MTLVASDAGPAVALVRRPGPRVAEGLVENSARVPVDASLALTQWHGYVAALHAAGWRTVEVAAADDCPDAVFVEDTVVMVDDVAVLTAPARESRRPGVPGTAAALEALGCATVALPAGATLEGGDVLKSGRTVYVGRSDRTDDAGVAALAAVADEHGRQVVVVPVTKVLHLKSAITALSDGTVMGFEPLVDDPGVFADFLAVPEPEGAAVVLLGGSRLLVSAAAPRTADLLAARGWDPVPVAIGELEKLEGCVTCLSVRLRHLTP